MDWKALLKSLKGYSWSVRAAHVETSYPLVVSLFTVNIVPLVLSRVFTPICYYRYTIAGRWRFIYGREGNW